MKYEPKPYQEIMIRHMAKHDRCAIWANMGLGKTSACLLYLKYLALYDHSKILIIAPLRVARDVWPLEIKKWDEFKDMSVSPIIGNCIERRRALLVAADIYTINFENLVWLVNTVGKRWPWRTVIIDESTKIKSFRLRQGGKRAHALAKMTWTKIEKVIELTGTPAPNALLDLWGQLWFIDKGERLGRTYTAYNHKYFRYEHPDSKTLVPYDHAIKEIPARVQDVCVSINAEDWFDLKKPIYAKIPVYLTSPLRAQYEKFRKTMILHLTDGTAITAVFAAALTMKCLQFVNGAVYTGESVNGWSEVHTLKLEALDSILAEAPGENIIVAYNFKSDLARLQKYYPHGVLLDQRSATLEKWNKGEISLLFAHPASAGHGLNLQDGGRIIVFFGHSWSMENREQIIARIGPVRQMQSGHNRAVYVYDIYAHNTIDELVLLRHSSKKAIQNILLTATKDNTYV